VWQENETYESVLFRRAQNKGMQMRLQDTVDFLIMGIACESLVQLWFHAEPLQEVRQWLIKHTTFLCSADTHLLDCPYCLSVWVGALMMVAYLFMEQTVFMAFSGALIIHRLSNYLHLIFSFLRDKQFDARVARGK
jgi:hypothetical protein